MCYSRQKQFWCYSRQKQLHDNMIVYWTIQGGMLKFAMQVFCHLEANPSTLACGVSAEGRIVGHQWLYMA